MATCLGLDIGTRTITGAVVTGTAKKIRVLDFFVEEIPDVVSSAGGPPTAETVDLEEGLPPSVGEVVRRVLAERRLQGIDVVASLDAKDCVIRDRVSVPYTRDDQIQKMIAYEAEHHLITFDVEEMVLEHHKVGEHNGHGLVILMAYPDRVVAERLAVLREGGVDPIALDLDGAALFNAFAMTPTFDPDRTTLLIDVGATTTKVVLVEKGRLKMIRSLRLGAYAAAHAARQIPEPVGVGVGAGRGESAADFEFPDASSIEARFDEIENALRRIDAGGLDSFGQALGTGDDEPIAILSDDEYARVTDDETPGLEGVVAGAGEAVGTATLPVRADEAPRYDYQEFLARLGIELQRSFSTSMMAPVDLIVLTGGLGEREEARRFLADAFDVEAIALDFGGPGETFEMEDEVERRSPELNKLGAVAVGLAVKELGKDRVGLDFRKKQFRYERKFEKLKFPLLCLSVMTCALFLWTAYDRFSRWQDLRIQLEDIRRKEAAYFEAFFDEPFRGQGLVMPAVSAQESKYNTQLGKGSEIPQFMRELEALRDIADVLKAARSKGLQFEIRNINTLFQLRKRPTGAKKGSRDQPSHFLEKDWTITLVAGEMIGEEFRKLFNSMSKVWTASPDSRQRGAEVQITLTLKAKDSYLKSLQ